MARYYVLCRCIGCSMAPSPTFPALVEEDPGPRFAEKHRIHPHVSSAFDRCGHASRMSRTAPMLPGARLHLGGRMNNRCLLQLGALDAVPGGLEAQGARLQSGDFWKPEGGKRTGPG